MAQNVHHNQHKVGHMKMTIINFQKVDDQIKTSFQSTCEIDYDVCDLIFIVLILCEYVYMLLNRKHSYL